MCVKKKAKPFKALRTQKNNTYCIVILLSYRGTGLIMEKTSFKLTAITYVPLFCHPHCNLISYYFPIVYHHSSCTLVCCSMAWKYGNESIVCALEDIYLSVSRIKKKYDLTHDCIYCSLALGFQGFLVAKVTTASHPMALTC